MCKIIVVANQKGGVAKTSTVRNLSRSLTELGKRVLAVDFDPQFNLTTCFGIENPNELEHTTATLMTDMLNDEETPSKKKYIHSIGKVDFIPSSIQLSVVDANLRLEMGSEHLFSNLLDSLREDYDYILVDTCPSLGTLTISALTSADEVMIPVNPQLLAVMGLQELTKTILKIKRRLNPKIQFGGILLTMCDKRTNLYKEISSQVDAAYRSGMRIFDSQIPTTVKVGEANCCGLSVLEYDKKCPAGQAYIIEAMMKDGDYPEIPEQEPDLIGNLNIPDEVQKMENPDYQKALATDTQALEDMELGAVLETVSVFEQADAMEDEEEKLFDSPNADDVFLEYSPLFVSRVLFDEAYLDARKGFADGQKARIECVAAVDRILNSLPVSENADLHQVYTADSGFRERLLDYVFERTYTDFVKLDAKIERMGQPKAERKNTAVHRNYGTFARLFPQIVSGEYSYLRLESKGFEPLSVERLGGNQVSIMHTFTQNGDLMRDPDMVIELNTDEETIQAVSYELSSMGIYQEVYAGTSVNAKLQKDLNSFLSDWLHNIENQGYEPVRAVALQNDEDVEIDLTEQTEQKQEEPAVTAATNEQLTLFGITPKSKEDGQLEFLMGERGTTFSGGKQRIYEFAQTNPTGSAFASFLKKEYGIGGGTVGQQGIHFVNFGSNGISYDWTDENGERQETHVTLPPVYVRNF